MEPPPRARGVDREPLRHVVHGDGQGDRGGQAGTAAERHPDGHTFRERVDRHHRDDQDRLRAGGDERLDLGDVRQVAILRVERVAHRDRARQPDHGDVVRPARIGDEDLVPLADVIEPPRGRQAHHAAPDDHRAHGRYQPTQTGPSPKS